MENYKTIRKTVSLDLGLYQAFCKRFGVERYQFTAAIQGAMIACIKDPRPYWQFRAKKAKAEFDKAMETLKALDEVMLEDIQSTEAKNKREQVYKEIMGGEML